MAQLPSSKIVDPFGEVNVFPQQDGTLKIKATILMTPSVEGAQTGLAIDGSKSMQEVFGGSPVVSTLFGGGKQNYVEPVAQAIAAYLANFDSDGQTTLIYWACGAGGAHIEELGDVDSAGAKTKKFLPPKQFGTGTRLLPAVKYFTEQKFPNAPWAIFVFITDGLIEDLQDVKQYTLSLAQQIAAGKRQFVKFVLIGVGKEVDVGQMEELDDLDYGGLKDPKGQDIDIWDHDLAAEMQRIEEIFKEVVSTDTILVPSADILDGGGNPVKPIGRASYKDGLPALLEFVVPKGTKEFSLVVPGAPKIVQTIDF